MQNPLNFLDIELLEAELYRQFFTEELYNLEVISIGIEGFQQLVRLKDVYPDLRVGYVYYEALDYLSDMKGNPIGDSYTYIPLCKATTSLHNGTSYRVDQMNNDAVYQFLNSTHEETLIIGVLSDPILVKLLDFYAFSHLELLLRRPIYFENSSKRPFINRYLRFTNLSPTVQVIDTEKMRRCLKKLMGFVNLNDMHTEIEAQWMAHIADRLSLAVSDEWDEPRIRIEATRF